MKKFLTLLLALTMVFAIACPAFAEAENFAADVKWDKGHAEAVAEADGVVTATGFPNKWSAPAVDILPAIKNAIGEDDEIELAIIFDARINFKADSTEESSSASIILRGTNGIAGLSGAANMDAWLEEYDESLDGEDRFFTNSNGNILRYCGDQIEITSEWQTFSATILVTNAQVNNSSVIKWNFSLDKLLAYESFESLEIKNFQVVLADEMEDVLPEETEAPAEKPAEKPAGDAADKPAAEVTQKPAVQTPSATVTGAPEAEGNNGGTGNATVNTTAVLTTAIVCAAIIIIACVAAVIVVKKKTTK